MKTKATESKEKRTRKRFRVQDEPRLFFILQMVFSAAQILLAYVAIGEKNLQPGGMAIFALCGVALIMIAFKGWQSRGLRVLGRSLAGLLIFGFAAILVLDAFTTKVSTPNGVGFVERTFGDYMGQLISNFCLHIQALNLFIFPTFAIAARRIGKTVDIWLLRISSWLLVALSAATLILSNDTLTRLDFTAKLLDLVPNAALLYVFLFFTIASTFAVFMLYPYGTKWVKRLVEKTRAKLGKKAE
ncbi:MAG: hypothetical protein J6R77_05395 [Clostridia bacterium]|nr:hypothetical protein [Clostridia bacterium]